MLVRDLTLILDAIDEELLVHVDDQGHLAVGTAERLLGYAVRLAEGGTTFAEVYTDWEDWYPLVSAFVEAYQFEDMGEMFDLAPLGEPEGRPVTHADEAFLQGGGMSVPVVEDAGFNDVSDDPDGCGASGTAGGPAGRLRRRQWLKPTRRPSTRSPAASIVEGQQDGTYEYLLPVRRDQMASFLMRLADLVASDGNFPADRA